MNENWKDKTCEKCIFQVHGQCRRSPPSLGRYPNVISTSVQDNAIYGRACAEYKEPHVDKPCIICGQIKANATSVSGMCLTCLGTKLAKDVLG